MSNILQGKHAVVFGAGGSIGAAVAKEFAAEGAEVFLAGRTKSNVEEVARQITATGCSSGRSNMAPCCCRRSVLAIPSEKALVAEVANGESALQSRWRRPLRVVHHARYSGGYTLRVNAPAGPSVYRC